MTILTSVDTLSGEIASGTIQAVATKPVPRWQVLVGKWFGFVGMLTAYIAIMVGGVNAVTYVMAGVTARHLMRGCLLMWMESLVLLSVTFAFATYFSTLTSGVLALGLHGLAFLGGWIEQFGALTQTQRAVSVGVVASVLMPSEALWRRCFRDAVSASKRDAHFSIQHALSSEQGHGLLCRAIPRNCASCRHPPLLPARSLKLRKCSRWAGDSVTRPQSKGPRPQPAQEPLP
jgi:hypothetical protein